MKINERVINAIQALLDVYEYGGQTEGENIACEEARNVLQLVKNLTMPLVVGRCKVYDIETDSLHDLVSIDFDNSRVVMENKDYGHTSNTWDKVRLIQI